MGPKSLLVAVFVVGLGAAPALAQVPVGIDLGPATDMPPALFQETVARLKVNGIKSVRVAFDLANAADEGVRLKAYKNVVTTLRANGIEVLALLDRSIVRGERDPLGHRVLSKDPETKGEAERWIKAYAAAAGRIVRTFKDEIQDFEVLNEPNRPLKDDRTDPWVSPERFAQVLAAAHREIKAARSDARVISGPLLFDDSVAGSVDDQIKSVVGYMKRTVRVAERGDLWDSVDRPFDSVGLHPFILQVQGQRVKDDSTAVRGYAAATLGKLVHGLVRATGVTGMDVTVSGVGVALQPKDRVQPDPMDMNQERLRQAFLLDKVIGTLSDRGLPVRAVLAFFAYDYGTGESRQRFGLLERDGGKERPAFHVLRYHASRVGVAIAAPVFDDGLEAGSEPHAQVAVSQVAPSCVTDLLGAARSTVPVLAAAATKGMKGAVSDRP